MVRSCSRFRSGDVTQTMDLPTYCNITPKEYYPKGMMLLDDVYSD
jgi:hypothetical protein